MAESESTQNKAQADKVAETFTEFGKLFIAFGITVLAIVLLVAMIVS